MITCKRCGRQNDGMANGWTAEPYITATLYPDGHVKEIHDHTAYYCPACTEAIAAGRAGVSDLTAELGTGYTKGGEG